MIHSIRATKESLSGSSKGPSHAGVSGQHASLTLVVEDYELDLQSAESCARMLEAFGRYAVTQGMNDDTFSLVVSEASEVLGIDFVEQLQDEPLQKVYQLESAIGQQVFSRLEDLLKPHHTFINSKRQEKETAQAGSGSSLISPKNRALLEARLAAGQNFEGPFDKASGLQTFATNVRVYWSNLRRDDQDWLTDNGFNPVRANQAQGFLARFQELVAHKETHGVLGSFSDQRPLMMWLGNVRKIWRQFKESANPLPKSIVMWKERQQLLESIGYSLDESIPDQRFRKQCAEFKRYVKKYRRMPTYKQKIYYWYHKHAQGPRFQVAEEWRKELIREALSYAH